MAVYFRSLGISPGLVSASDRGNRGLLFTLATAADDVSTLDLASRPEMGIGSEEVRLTGTGSGGPAAEVATVSRKEILLALLQHGRLTEMTGANCGVDALAEHVALRQNIVAWAERLRWGWPNGGPAEWNGTYWDRGTPRAGVSVREAVDDAFANQKAYAIGCYTATKLVMVKGVLDYFERVRGLPGMSRWLQARLLSDHEPLYDVEPPAAWSFEPDYDPHDGARPGKLLSMVHGVAPKNFVPGDWAYLLNPDPVSSQKTGYEGSNAIYLGGGRFDDYYGENNHAFTYAEKLDEVFQWRNGVFNRQRDADKRQLLTGEELERLGRSPEQGGLVETWRIAPPPFGAAMQETTAAPVSVANRLLHLRNTVGWRRGRTVAHP
jgi:hypothetical protein